MKKALFTWLLLFVTFFASAQVNRLYINDVKVIPGQTQAVTINLDNQTPFVALQCHLVLPEGLNIEKKSNGRPKVTIVDGRSDGHSVSTSIKNGGIQIIVTSTENALFLGNSGAFLTFNVTVDAGFTGPEEILVQNIVASTIEEVKYTLDPATCTVTSRGDDNYVVVAPPNFTDGNLIDWLVDQPFVTIVDGEPRLYDSDAEEVTSLDLSDLGISNPTGLENFPNLNDLDITGNDITGDNLDQLIDALPERPDGDGVIHIDNNDITADQISDLNDKGWTVLDENGNPAQGNPESYIPIDAEHFPDPALLDDMLNEDFGDDAKLTTGEAEAVTSLDLSGDGITDPTGLEYFPNLSDLDITGNDITGENLDQLIDVLPERPDGDGVLHIDPEDITSDQVQDLNDKGWTVVDGDGNEIVPSPNNYTVVDHPNFNDDALIDFLRDQPYVKEVEGEYRLYENDAAGVTSLNLDNLGITDGKGLEYFPNLEELHICGDDITGDKMDELIAALPDRSATGDGKIYADKSDMSDEQRIDLYDKGWTVYIYDPETDEYEALDYIPIDAKHFPDANFREWLHSQSYGSEWKIYFRDIPSITSINVSNKNIADLTGLKYLTYLTYLNCSKNQLSTVDLSKNTALTRVVCYQNEINGDGVQDMVDNLPTVTNGTIYFKRDGDTSDKNRMSAEQVAIANGKGWSVKTWDEDLEDWVDYPGESSYAKGDVNEDGYVNVGDVTELYKIITGVDLTYAHNADLNGDGNINSGDVSVLYQLILQQ